ncbi:VWA containing CoxE family protein [Nostoc sp. NIES-4103]|nr:VWA containing CoxE family protein [Nostoc sp. NIES-4103]
MSQQKPPLFDLFIGSREEAGLPLTIDQYYLLVQALHGGFGIANRDELKQICRLLWVKSKTSLQAEKFEKYFEEYFQEYDDLFKFQNLPLQPQANSVATTPARPTSSDQSESSLVNVTSSSETSENQSESSLVNVTSSSETSENQSESSLVNVTSSSETSENQSESSPNVTESSENSKNKSESPLNVTGSSEESLQNPIAIGGKLLPPKPFKEDKYQLNARDFPVTERQIQQNWRYLRRPMREGESTEIDIEASIDKICQDGVFLESVLIPNRVNRAELLLLIDVSNSMVPFYLLSQKLVDNLQGGRLGKAETYYFRNCPQNYLYFHPQRPQAKLIQDLLPKLHSKRTIALIISDGGAARGGINRDRIRQTKEFIAELSACVRHVAWLNPVPEERWQSTTAEGISQSTQMFELNSSGLKAAIRSGKG